MKTQLKITVHSVIDLITNSSSELFIINGKKTIEQIKEIIWKLTEVYNFTEKQIRPTLILEMSEDELQIIELAIRYSNTSSDSLMTCYWGAASRVECENILRDIKQYRQHRENSNKQTI